MTERNVDTRAVAAFADVQLSDMAAADCSRVEFDVMLYEHENAGVAMESWPPAVRNLIERGREVWLQRHPDVKLIAITSGVARRNCVLMLHYRNAK